MEIAAKVAVQGKGPKNENLNQIMDSKEIAAGKTQLLKLAIRINAEVGSFVFLMTQRYHINNNDRPQVT